MNRRIAIVPLACWLVITSTSAAADGPQLQQETTLARSTTNASALLPSGDQVIRRLLERSATEAAATNAPAWAYDKRTTSEKLGRDGKVQERTVKLYRVRIIQGVPFSRLVKVEGRDLTEAEIKKENQREAAFQKRLSGRDPKKAVDEGESFITTNVVERFQYRTLRREAIHGRQTIVVSFEAKPGKDDDKIEGRLLSRLAGTLWVDEALADVAQLEVHLTKAFSMGVLGVLGALKECRMDLACRPMSDGTWLPEKTKMSVSARMFLSNVRYQMEETASNFTSEPVAEAVQP